MTDNERRFLTLQDFCRRYAIGRTKAYEEIAAGRLKIVKVGRSTRIPLDAAKAWEALLRGEVINLHDAAGVL
jgi:excisionase family DNA binding protein